ncbi:hypothetical protein C8R45DRAFT_929364 [Mycena sanguinolenta]|nr:hypothetical protein C8R45DRAFT_929364 [Mycena sanguinolenta]
MFGAAAASPNSTMNLSSSFGFSNNLVEVSALTALIGSSVAESMVLGNRGSGGLAWAATSSFGTISVVKSCCSAASSGWLRETLGIRTPLSDSAVGMCLPHDSARASKVRRNAGDPIALFCRRSTEMPPRNIKDENTGNTQISWSDVYALDHSTSMMLRGVPETPVGVSLEIHTYAQYPFFRAGNSVFQAITISLSVAKLAEVYVLWSHGAALLGIISATPWLFFCAGAILVEIREMIRGRRPEPALGTVDIIAGQLPMIGRRGGGRKIVLGAADNPRTGLAWQLFWLLGATVSAVSILFSYITLGQQDPHVVLIWAGFQFLWLGVRILIYHVTDAVDPMALRILVARSWYNLPKELKKRVFELACGLAQCQTFVHPRGRRQYLEDTFSFRQLGIILDGSDPARVYTLPSTPPSSVALQLTAVLGDTLLSSIIWIAGSEITPMDLYDSCIVVFSLQKSTSVASRTIAIPAVRVLSGPSEFPIDSKHSLGATFVPKGAPNRGYGLTWWYWVPCGEGLWVQIRRPTEHRILDSCEGEIRTDAQVSELLTSGTLNIGLRTVEEVRAILELSRKAGDVLAELFN